MALLEIRITPDPGIAQWSMTIDDQDVDFIDSDGNAEVEVQNGGEHRAIIHVFGATDATADYEIKQRGERLIAGRIKIPFDRPHAIAVADFRLDS